MPMKDPGFMTRPVGGPGGEGPIHSEEKRGKPNREPRKNVLFYAAEGSEAGDRLQRFLESRVPGCRPQAFRTIEKLAERLKSPGGALRVAVLQAGSHKDLEELIALRRLLEDVKTILLAPDREEGTIALAHQLRPRFLASVNNDLGSVAAVLEKMLAHPG